MEQERQEENQKLTKKISPYKIIYPIIIGLAVVSYMLYKEFDPKAFDMITFNMEHRVLVIRCRPVYGHPGFRVYYPDQNTVRRETKLDSVHPGHIPLGIHLGRNSLRHRGNQPGDPFRA